VTVYAVPGAFSAALNWHRVGTGALDRVVAERPPAPAERIATPTTVLWPEHDPLFPTAWADRLGEFLADVDVRHVDAGHFLRLEAPAEFAAAAAAAAATRPGLTLDNETATN
jgi:pimeloyl-ACP methyl ester carboxylesterase